MRLGIGLGGSLATVTADAGAAEAAGFESAWVAELTHSAFVQAAAAIGATRRLAVGTAVALAFPRSPTISAMEAWDLDELSGGRFVLGLGTQVRRVIEDRFSVPFEHPASRLAEYARAIRTVWAANRGAPVSHAGDFYRIAMPTFHGPVQPDRPDVPILFAAVGPTMARIAGEVADGVLGHPLASPRYLGEVVGPAIESGLLRAARPVDACPISASVVVAVGDDADAARRAARLQLAFYATTPLYRSILELHGRAGIQHDLRRAFVRRDEERMAGLIDDPLLDAIAIAGRPDEVRDRLAAWKSVAHLDRAILAPPWYRIDAGAAREMTAAIIDVIRSV